MGLESGKGTDRSEGRGILQCESERTSVWVIEQKYECLTSEVEQFQVETGSTNTAVGFGGEVEHK